MNDEFLLMILYTSIATIFGTWATFRAQDKHREAKFTLIFGGVIVFLYLIFLSFHYGSVVAFLYGVWTLLFSNVKWWQIILLTIIVVVSIKLLDKWSLKLSVERGIAEEEKRPKDGRKGVKNAIFKWIGEKGVLLTISPQEWKNH